ncbi:MAG: TonB-dependent receptor [Acidobacteriota bacterium]
MQLARLNQKLTVSSSNGQLGTSASENADVIKLNQRVLSSLPIQGNDVVGAVTKMMGPGAQAPGGVQIVVNGIPLSDPKVPASAIQEIKINKDPYSALYSSPGQKRVEITTKTGSQHYHGSADVLYDSSRLNARNAFATERPPEQLVYYGGSLSGPVGKSKKATFMINGERDSDDMQATVYAQTPSGTVSQNYPTPFTSTYFSSVVDWQPKEAHQLSFRYNYYGSSYDGKNVGGLSLPESAANNSGQNHYISVADRSVLTKNLVNELSLRLISSDNSTQSALPGQPSIVVLGAFTGGGAQQSSYEMLRYLQLTDILSWSHERHVVKVGLNVPALTRWNINDQSNFGGTFQFSSLQDYEQGKPFSFVQNQGDGRLVFWQKELGLFAQDEVRLRHNLSVSIGLRYDWQNYVSNLLNFAPRFSFAYAPGKSTKTVLRGGAGVFYQMTGGEAIMDRLRYDGNTLLQYVVSNPGYPNPFGLGGVAQALPSSIVQFAPHLRLPYVIQYGFSLERQLTRSTTFTAAYIGMQGIDQFLSQDINAPLPPNYVERPNPAIATLRQIESSGRMKGSALKLSLNSSLGHIFSGGAQYELGRSMDNTGGIDWFPANQYNMAGEWGRSNFDIRNSFSFYGTVNMPKLLRFGTIMTIESGRPYTETTGTDVYGTTFSNARPPGVARNMLNGPGGISLDVRLAREFALHGHKSNGAGGPSLALGVDAFNVLNHTNLREPVGDLTSPFFGQSIAAGPPRRLQLSLRFQF